MLESPTKHNHVTTRAHTQVPQCRRHQPKPWSELIDQIYHLKPGHVVAFGLLSCFHNWHPSSSTVLDRFLCTGTHYNYASSSNHLFSYMIALGRGRSWHPSSSIPNLTWDYQSIHSALHNYRSLLNLTIHIFKKLEVDAA